MRALSILRRGHDIRTPHSRQKNRQLSVDYEDFGVVARDGIDTPTVVDSTQLTVSSSHQTCQNVQISNSLAQIWHKFA
jgi:hypothetical protein